MRNRKKITLVILAVLALTLVAPVAAQRIQGQNTSRAKRNSVVVLRRQNRFLSEDRAENTISQDESVLTQHNNITRTGVFPRETALTPSSVRNLKRLYIRKVEGQIAAQPLFVKGVSIGGVNKDVLYVVTRRNFIYAFDVNNTKQNDPKNGQAWPNPIELTYTDPVLHSRLRAAPLPGMDDGNSPCLQTHGPVGITSTPVIDPASQVMYVVFRVATPPGSRPRVDHHFIAAIDIQTGQELRRNEITFPASGNYPAFDPAAQLNRPGLLLLGNVVYIAFGAAVCDNPNPRYHGWVFAYSTPTLERVAAFNTTPQTWGGGIWQSGSGLAADERRRFVYAFTGDNHDADFIAQKQTGQGADRDDRYHRTRTELGESILRLSLVDGRFECSPRYSNCVPEHFTAGNWYRLDTGRKFPGEHVMIKGGGDADLGSGGPVVLQNGFIVGGGKQGRVYVLDPNNMRVAKQGFQAFVNSWHLPTPRASECKALGVSNPFDGGNCFVSERDYDMAQAYGPNIHGSLVVWQRAGADFGYMYGMAEKDYLKAFKVFRSGRVEEHPTMTTKTASIIPPVFPKGLRSPDGMPGAALSLSSNGDRDAVLWVSLAPAKDATNTIEPGILMAFDATTLDLLWFDADNQVYFAKFVPPTIAGGKVFRATFGDHDPSCTRADPRTQVWPSCGSVVVYGLQ
ncbi:MAG: hypothetical protein WAV47_06610 [Blastocatellia bacterium]